ncbi:hypothetical protein SLEP1_g27318 [Rubroshorea leprosula]|uniref:Uncharacterized protein n=1 Tax=Rubroshorea leprosula TaxID=152421 RepID=A0AAV5JVI4_9ROSI|nr:hypothetical protein SLEP1_g27318 [Rubroshorea leprosula]
MRRAVCAFYTCNVCRSDLYKLCFILLYITYRLMFLCLSK